MQLVDGKIFSSGFYERYSDIPVETDGSSPRCMMYIKPDIPNAGDIWTITVEIHVTNDDLRARGSGVACTTEVRIGEDTSHARDGFKVIRANGSFNVGVEAHHGLILRTKSIEWTQAMIDDISGWTDLAVKFMVWGSSTAAISGDRLVIDEGRGFMQLRIDEA